MYLFQANMSKSLYLTHANESLVNISKEMLFALQVHIQNLKWLLNVISSFTIGGIYSLNMWTCTCLWFCTRDWCHLPKHLCDKAMKLASNGFATKQWNFLNIVKIDCVIMKFVVVLLVWHASFHNARLSLLIRSQNLKKSRIFVEMWLWYKCPPISLLHVVILDISLPHQQYT
jgi:hypothetical protein